MCPEAESPWVTTNNRSVSVDIRQAPSALDFSFLQLGYELKVLILGVLGTFPFPFRVFSSSITFVCKSLSPPGIDMRAAGLDD